MILALIFIGLVIVAVAFAYFATKAPVGYQDDEGFHFGCEERTASLPQEEKIVPLRFPISWTKPALGLAALILLLLTVGLQPDQNQAQVHTAPRDSAETPPRENTMFVGPSAQLFPNFCQRDTEIQ